MVWYDLTTHFSFIFIHIYPETFFKRTPLTQYKLFILILLIMIVTTIYVMLTCSAMPSIQHTNLPTSSGAYLYEKINLHRKKCVIWQKRDCRKSFKWKCGKNVYLKINIMQEYTMTIGNIILRSLKAFYCCFCDIKN